MLPVQKEGALISVANPGTLQEPLPVQRDQTPAQRRT